ncbi:hypothetical protein FRC19_008028 [Serendipita sp. 401]|nr:hypothetical protein FRC19_008028 [Serendipita sp. 401]KAG9055600.1 hypothetical protein FS842_001745 [Serendipita sp. 407]
MSSYTVKIDDAEFKFTKDQLDSEPGNELATFFLQGIDRASNSQSTGKVLRLEKDPLLFKLIQAHLRGYDVLPIPDTLVPNYMSKEGALENLQRDARSLGLRRLEDKVLNYQLNLARGTQVKIPVARKKYKLATFRKSWVVVDITEEGYRTLLDRFSKRNFQVVAPSSLQCPGYTIVVCWRDFEGAYVPELALTKESHCALLESND